MDLERIIGVRSNKTVYRDGAYTVKVFEPNGPNAYKGADVLHEAFKMASVAEVGLPVPKLHGAGLREGKWTIVSEYIGGKSLDRLMLENPEDKPRYLGQLARLHRSVHAHTVRNIERMHDELNRLIASSDLPATVRFDFHRRIEEMPRMDCLCHGDFHPTNLIFSSTGDPYIIDWEYACMGDPCADAAITYLELWLDGDEAGAEEYCAAYCDEAACGTDQVKQWLPIMAAALSVGRVLSDREKLFEWIL